MNKLFDVDLKNVHIILVYALIMYSVQMKVANYIAYSIGHKPSGMMRSL